MAYGNAKALDEAYIMHTFGRYPVEFVSGKGAILTDSEGKRYIDFLGGIGVLSLGHRHPAVQRALEVQVGKLWQSSNSFLLAHPVKIRLNATSDMITILFLIFLNI